MEKKLIDQAIKEAYEAHVILQKLTGTLKKAGEKISFMGIIKAMETIEHEIDQLENLSENLN